MCPWNRGKPRLWLAPAPEVRNQLDAKAVAEYLKPAIVDALKRR